MGLFSSKYNHVESQLLEQYSDMWSQDMGLDRNAVKEALNEAIEASKKQGTYNLPSNFGNIILCEENTNDDSINKIAELFKKHIQINKAEGFTDKDIRWWYNLNDVERNMMIKTDELHKVALFMDVIEKGETPEKAAAKVRKYHVVYGNPKDTSKTSGDDRPLPYELKDRINIYLNKSRQNPERMKRDIEKSKTMNAIIRKEIRNGKI